VVDLLDSGQACSTSRIGFQLGSVLVSGAFSFLIIGIGATTGYQLALSEVRDLPDEV
jgi:hypothetical protein